MSFEAIVREMRAFASVQYMAKRANYFCADFNG